MICILIYYVQFDIQVIFSADNGQGQMTATYTPDNDNELCDGEWHTIRGTIASISPPTNPNVLYAAVILQETPLAYQSD